MMCPTCHSKETKKNLLSHWDITFMHECKECERRFHEDEAFREELAWLYKKHQKLVTFTRALIVKRLKTEKENEELHHALMTALDEIQKLGA